MRGRAFSSEGLRLCFWVLSSCLRCRRLGRGQQGVQWLILYVNLTGSGDTQITGNALFLGVSVRAFLE
jgi:hypothetical protein